MFWALPGDQQFNQKPFLIKAIEEATMKEIPNI